MLKRMRLELEKKKLEILKDQKLRMASFEADSASRDSRAQLVNMHPQERLKIATQHSHQ